MSVAVSVAPADTSRRGSVWRTRVVAVDPEALPRTTTFHTLSVGPVFFFVLPCSTSTAESAPVPAPDLSFVTCAQVTGSSLPAGDADTTFVPL